MHLSEAEETLLRWSRPATELPDRCSHRVVDALFSEMMGNIISVHLWRPLDLRPGFDLPSTGDHTMCGSEASRHTCGSNPDGAPWW